MLAGLICEATPSPYFTHLTSATSSMVHVLMASTSVLAPPEKMKGLEVISSLSFSSDLLTNTIRSWSYLHLFTICQNSLRLLVVLFCRSYPKAEDYVAQQVSYPLSYPTFSLVCQFLTSSLSFSFPRKLIYL